MCGGISMTMMSTPRNRHHASFLLLGEPLALDLVNTLVPPAYGQAYARHLPQAKFQTIPNCGHLAMFEKEKEFVEAVTRFCREG